ncbi:MAG: OadG family protein [Pseudomonadales bacterium]|nr:OadG family protein [Pseudomonadales bacterium]
MSELLAEGLFLMLFGMGTVAVFLTTLVLTTKTMSAVLSKLGFVDTALTHPAPQPVAQSNKNDPQNEELVAVITAAISQFRSRHK